MLFMAEMEVRLPWDMTTEQVEGLELREQVYSEALSAMGACRISGRIAGRYSPRPQQERRDRCLTALTS
jgi:muconolactone delta-isomerase